ncbi:fasciclin domain-containing protein [Aequorivita sp. H23M31]|uniref:Fasciclin domain-containing protein n=1 Tax=Aequorivita ciconiae TaxID=2494375 RepID=A0A451FSC0_9FLAO|nr:fasciclin domain-containing protein [Aequorivita sp. H23M31]QAA80290.1 fasciclin domain-containing protein [Aequorivita sp. H23M31]
MFRQIGLFFVVVSTLLLFSCKNEGSTEAIGTDMKNVGTEKTPVQKTKRRVLTAVEKQKANSIMARLIAMPETKRFTRYLVSGNLADKLTNEAGPFIIFSVADSVLEKWPETKRKYYSDQTNYSEMLTLIKSHIVEGNYDENSLRDVIKKNGKIRLTTLEGNILTIRDSNGQMEISDGKGRKAKIQRSDSPASNGQIFIIDGVLDLP